MPCLFRWGDLEFPLPFGRSMTAAEEYVHDLDSKTGASLKLSILNPKVSAHHRAQQLCNVESSAPCRCSLLPMDPTACNSSSLAKASSPGVLLP